MPQLNSFCEIATHLWLGSIETAFAGEHTFFKMCSFQQIIPQALDN